MLPLSGDPAAIRSSAAGWLRFAGAAESASSDIRRIDSGDFRGDEADLYRERMNADLPPHLDTTSQAWSTVSSALERYATSLESLQQRLSALSRTAADQQVQAAAAHDAVADAHTADARHTSSVEAEQRALPAGQTLAADNYASQAGAASGRLAEANAALQATTDAANQVHADHDAAVDACVGAIIAAAGLRFQEPPGFWGRLGAAVGGWIREHADVLTAISGVLKQISSIAGLLAMIPVLAPVMGPIAAAAGAGSVVIDGAVVLATGKGSMTDVLIDAAGMLPGGRAAGSVARGARAAREAMTADTVVGAGKAFASVGRTARSAEAVAAQSSGVSAAIAGAERTGGRAVDDTRSAVAHDTPVEKLPCVGDPIDVVTGEMVLALTDVELPGVLPLVLRRVYKSGYRWGGAFGSSWASTLDQRVELGSDGAACFVAEDGVVLHYVAVEAGSDGPWLPTEGVQRWPLRRQDGGGWTVEDPERRVTRFFAAGDERGSCVLLEIRDRHNNLISFGPGDSGVVSEIRHSGGYVVAVDSSRGLVTGLSIGDERVASFEYDELGQLVRDNNAAGIPLTLQWNSSRIVGWRDRNDIWYRYDYDESGRCVRTAGRGRVLSYGFSYLPGRTLVTDSFGAVTTYEYNAAHQLTRTVDPLGGVVMSVWDRYDRLLQRTDPLDRTTQHDYDDAGRLVGVTHPDGSQELLRRNARGDVVASFDAGGAMWSQEYDDTGRMTSTRGPLGAVAAVTYSAQGAVETITDPRGAVTTVRSNVAGLPISVSDPLGATSRIDYDGRGRIVRSVDALGSVTSFGWTARGRLAYRVGPDGAREEWTWDQEGNLTSFSDAIGARTVIENGVFDLPVARTGPDGGRMTFGYDTELRLTVVQNPAGRRWRYEYDAAGRLVAETDFNNRTQRYRYDAAGQLLAVVNGFGVETRLSYDAVGNLVERSTADGVTRLTHDAVGRLTTAASPGATVTFDRDAAGRIVRETVNGRSVTVDLDAAGRRASRTTPSGVRSDWQFDSAGRPVRLTIADQRVAFEHDALGREVGRAFDRGGQLEQCFDVGHRLVGQRVSASADLGSTPAVLARTFDYRPDGTLTGVGDLVAGTSRRFDLDAAGRVAGVTAAGWTEDYAYDLAGRIRRDTAQSDSVICQSAAQRAYEGSLVARAGAITYGYDRQGRLVRRSRKRLSQPPELWHFRYDADDRMVSAASAGEYWSYRYDAFGRRISKQRLGVDGQVIEQILFTWDGNVLIEQERKTPGAIPVVTTWEYLPGSWTPISQTVTDGDAEAQFYAVVSDLIGTPTELVTPDGRRIVWTGAAATVWGAPRHKAANGSTRFGAPSVDCPIRFPGQYADNETGLHYNRYRYYDPVSGRYTTADPLGLAPADDPYAYVLNPTGWADPLGLTPCAGPANNGGRDSEGRLPVSGNIDPAAVRFTQNSIRATFKDGRTVDQLANDLRSGVVEPTSIPAIRIFEHDGVVHSLDNRRLAAYQQAGVKIPYRLATPYEIADEISRKSTTKNGGTSIRVRGAR